MSEIHDECGIAAVYHLPSDEVSPLCGEYGANGASRLLPRMLLDIQNRGQLAAGMTTYKPDSRPVDRHAQGLGYGQRGLSAVASRQERELDEGVRGTGRDRPRALRHVWRG